jgi:ISXO2-like transposase domain
LRSGRSAAKCEAHKTRATRAQRASPGRQTRDLAEWDFGACTNAAEEFFSRMRRAEIGHHHHIAGVYLLRYAREASWREDNRRVSNGDQVNRLAGLALKRGKSVDFTGYWQRHIDA